jgi:hypothetical protein
MKSKQFIVNILFLLMFFLLLLLLILSINYSLPYEIDSNDLFYLLKILPIILISTIIIEFVVMYVFLRNHGIEHLQLIKPVIAVNFLSFPITQIIVIFFMDHYSTVNGFILLVELFPITLEYFLYLKIFKYYSQLKYFEFPVSVKKTFLTSITANSITFTVGLLIFLSQSYVLTHFS